MDPKYVYLHLPNRWTTSNYHLNFINQELPKIFEKMKSVEQAEFEFHTRVEESVKYDIVVSWGLDYLDREPTSTACGSALKVTLWDDFQWGLYDQVKAYRHSLIDRSDLILTPNYHTVGTTGNGEFRNKMDKVEFFPYHIDESRVNVSIEPQIDKFILSGDFNTSLNSIEGILELADREKIGYSMRSILYLLAKDRSDIDVLTHNEFRQDVVDKRVDEHMFVPHDDEYINILSRYKFAFSVIDGSTDEIDLYSTWSYGHFTFKNIEIMASGAILVADEKPAFADLGLTPYIHYIPITRKNLSSNAHEFLNSIISMPESLLQEIRRNATSWVREYSNDKAANLLYEKLKCLMDRDV